MSEQAHSFVRIRSASLEALRALQSVHDLDVFGRTAKRQGDGSFEVQGLLSHDQVEGLRGLGYQVEVLRSAVEVARERREELRHPPPSGEEVE